MHLPGRGKHKSPLAGNLDIIIIFILLQGAVTSEQQFSFVPQQQQQQQPAGTPPFIQQQQQQAVVPPNRFQTQSQQNRFQTSFSSPGAVAPQQPNFQATSFPQTGGSIR